MSLSQSAGRNIGPDSILSRWLRESRDFFWIHTNSATKSDSVLCHALERARWLHLLQPGFCNKPPVRLRQYLTVGAREGEGPIGPAAWARSGIWARAPKLSLRRKTSSRDTPSSLLTMTASLRRAKQNSRACKGPVIRLNWKFQSHDTSGLTPLYFSFLCILRWDLLFIKY